MAIEKNHVEFVKFCLLSGAKIAVDRLKRIRKRSSRKISQQMERLVFDHVKGKLMKVLNEWMTVNINT